MRLNNIFKSEKTKQNDTNNKTNENTIKSLIDHN